MWGWEGSCVACNFFGSICMFFFSRVFLLAFILQPLPVVHKFFLRGIYMERLFFPNLVPRAFPFHPFFKGKALGTRLFFPHSPIYVNQHLFWCIVQSTMVAFFAKYYVLMRWIFAIACMTPVLGRIQKLRHVFNAQLIFLDTSIPHFWSQYFCRSIWYFYQTGLMIDVLSI